MKWIVKSDFYRTPQLKDIEIIGACKGASATPPHPNHIHRGAYFELGKAANEEEFQKTKDKDKELICMLRVTGRIGDASDPVLVARVESEIEADTKREAGRVTANKQADAASIVALLSEIIRVAQSRANATQ